MYIEPIKDVDICDEVKKQLIAFEFTEEEQCKILNSDLFIDAENKPSTQQKALITLLLHRVLMYGEKTPPNNIRLALNSSNSVIDWLDNVKLILFPYIKNYSLLS